MQIKELESLLGITKDNIRYYEKEGLLNPERKENGYRDYSEDDCTRLKKILVLRRIGIPVADIREILNGSKDLSAALAQTRQRIEQEISSMEEAKKICEELELEHVNIGSLDADRYLERIEENPSGFNDIAKDVLTYTGELFVESFGHFQWFFPVFKPLLWKRKRKGSVVLAVITLILLILNGGNVCWRTSIRNNGVSGHYFLKGMLTMCAIIFIWLMLRNITYFLSKRFGRHEKAIAVSGALLSALVSVLLFFGAILHWNRVLMFTPYKGPPVILNETVDSLRINADDEIAYADNDWTQSHRSTYYISYDTDYIERFKDAILSCETTGIWSPTKDVFSIFETREKSGIPDRFYQIFLGNQDPHESDTVFYVIHDDDGSWLLDEPDYGIFKADDRLISLINEYGDHLSLNEGTLFNFRQVFEYDPERIWPDSMYKDGRFDTYHYLTIEDQATGRDITDEFIGKYMESYENEDWETLIAAFKTVDLAWRIEYVNPDAAHMEGN